MKCDGLEKEIASLYKEIARMTYERANSGKPMHELSPRHARRKLLEFKENAEVALWLRKVTTCSNNAAIGNINKPSRSAGGSTHEAPPAIPIPDDPAPDEKNSSCR